MDQPGERQEREAEEIDGSVDTPDNVEASDCKDDLETAESAPEGTSVEGSSSENSSKEGKDSGVDKFTSQGNDLEDSQADDRRDNVLEDKDSQSNGKGDNSLEDEDSHCDGKRENYVEEKDTQADDKGDNFLEEKESQFDERRENSLEEKGSQPDDMGDYPVDKDIPADDIKDISLKNEETQDDDSREKSFEDNQTGVLRDNHCGLEETQVDDGIDDDGENIQGDDNEKEILVHSDTSKTLEDRQLDKEDNEQNNTQVGISTEDMQTTDNSQTDAQENGDNCPDDTHQKHYNVRTDTDDGINSTENDQLEEDKRDFPETRDDIAPWDKDNPQDTITKVSLKPVKPEVSRKGDQIVSVLADLPEVVQGLEMVRGTFKDTKRRSMLYITDVAEFSTHLAMAIAGRSVYKRFKKYEEKRSQYCCVCDDALEWVDPALRGPVEEALDFWPDVWEYAETITLPFGSERYARAAFGASDMIWRTGKGAWYVVRTCVWLSTLPAVTCVKAWASVTSFTIKTGLNAFKALKWTKSPEDEGQKKEGGVTVDSISGHLTLEMIEQMLYLVLPTCKEHSQTDTDVTIEAGWVARQILNAPKDADKSLKLTLCVMLGWILTLTTAGVTLVRQEAQVAESSDEVLVIHVDQVWKWCTHLWPHLLPTGMEPPTDPAERVAVMVKHLMRTVAERLLTDPLLPLPTPSSPLSGLSKGSLGVLKRWQQLDCGADWRVGEVPPRPVAQGLMYVVELLHTFSACVIGAVLKK